MLIVADTKTAYCSRSRDWYDAASMLRTTNQFVKNPRVFVIAALLGSAVVISATCGPVVKVSLLEAAQVRHLVSATTPSEPQKSGNEPVKRAPGTDPVLALCVQGDWDRAAEGRSVLEREPLPTCEDVGSSIGVRGWRGPSRLQNRSHPRFSPSAIVNPNSRTHAPPPRPHYALT